VTVALAVVSDGASVHVLRDDPAVEPVLSVVLPTYNEAGHVLAELERIDRSLTDAAVPHEIVVVDDASTDGTPDLVREWGRARLIVLERNRGAGTARKIGTRAAKGRYVGWTDVDLTYPNERFPEFVHELETAKVDQVVGARTTEEGTLKVLRTPTKWFVRRLASYLVRQPIPDLNSGMRVFRRTVADRYLDLLPSGFSCVSTLSLSFLANDHPVHYIDIDYKQRAGRSKFHPLKDTYLYLLQVLRMITYFEPLRIFGPIALSMLLLSVAKLGFDLIVHPFRVANITILLFLFAFNTLALGLLADLSSKGLMGRRREPGGGQAL
jgi:glycosyltransferase involved in cell wall biosynthesis